MVRAFSAEGSLTCEDMCGCRYSLTMHHSADELRAFGMTDDMIEDQEWYVGHGYLRKSFGHYYVSELVRGGRTSKCCRCGRNFHLLCHDEEDDNYL